MDSGSACTLILLPLDSGLTFSYHGWFILLNVRAKQFTLFPKSSEYSNPPMKDNTIKFLFIFWSTTLQGIHVYVRPCRWGEESPSHVNWETASWHHKSTTQRKSPFHLVRHSNLFEVPFLKTNSPFFNGQIWSLKFWKKKKPEKIHQSNKLKSLQTKLLKSHLIEMCVNLGFSTKLWGFGEVGQKPHQTVLQSGIELQPTLRWL